MGRKREGAERGAAIAEAIVFLPILLFAMCGSVDLGRMALAYAAADNAAYAACRLLAEDPAADDAALRSAALGAASALEGADALVEADVGEPVVRTYEHRMPADDGFGSRESRVASVPVEVRVSFDLRPATLAGEAIAAALGGEDIHVSARHASAADVTVPDGRDSPW